MSKARNIADLLESGGDVKLAALDNAPAPTKSTIDALGIAASSITGALPAISGASLTGFTDSQMPAGSVIQVVSAANGSDFNHSATSTLNVVQASITPSSTSSKILILYNFSSIYSAGNGEGYWSIYKDGSRIFTVDGITPYTGSSLGKSIGSISGTRLDSPSTTSAVVYSMRLTSNGVAIRLGTEGGEQVITLMEIKG